MRRSASLIAVVAFCVASGSEGAVVAPSKASQLVTLRPGAACPGGLLLDTRVNADGTETPFSVPESQVLVLDHLAWTVNGIASPGNSAGVVLRIDAEIVWSDTVALTGPNGTTGHSVALPNISVTSGKTVCLGVGSGGTVNPNVSRLHGFLAKDR
jgi:hypothetical protein